jgi:hypothetical protein
MTEFREWDWPPYPERHGARRRRRTSQPVLDLQVTRGAGSRKRSLYDHHRGPGRAHCRRGDLVRRYDIDAAEAVTVTQAASKKILATRWAMPILG